MSATPCGPTASSRSIGHNNSILCVWTWSLMTQSSVIRISLRNRAIRCKQPSTLSAAAAVDGIVQCFFGYLQIAAAKKPRIASP